MPLLRCISWQHLGVLVVLTTLSSTCPIRTVAQGSHSPPPAFTSPVETIIDSAHQRLILIRLDAAGHRLAAVPAFTPRATERLIPNYDGDGDGWGIVSKGQDHALFIDTGATYDDADDLIGPIDLMRRGVVGFNFRTRQFIHYQHPQ